MTHAIVHLPACIVGRIADRDAHGFPTRVEWIHPDDVIYQHAAAPSRPSLTIEVALTTHQVREPDDERDS